MLGGSRSTRRASRLLNFDCDRVPADRALLPTPEGMRDDRPNVALRDGRLMRGEGSRCRVTSGRQRRRGRPPARPLGRASVISDDVTLVGPASAPPPGPPAADAGLTETRDQGSSRPTPSPRVKSGVRAEPFASPSSAGSARRGRPRVPSAVPSSRPSSPFLGRPASSVADVRPVSRVRPRGSRSKFFSSSVTSCKPSSSSSSRLSPSDPVRRDRIHLFGPVSA